MLNGIHLVNYGNHRDTRLTFGRMTALVGQNGAGKTNVMRGISQMSNWHKEGPLLNETFEFLRSGSQEWLLEGSWDGMLLRQRGTWAVQIGSNGPPSSLWRKAALNDGTTWLPEQKEWDKSPTFQGDFAAVAPGAIIIPYNRHPPVNAWTGRYFKTIGAFLQGPSYSETIPPVLGEDCRDLAWVIAYLKGDQEDVFDAITGALKEVVPTFKRIRHRPAPVLRLEKKEIVINKQSRSYDEEQKVMGQELRFDMASGKDLSAASISEGTLVALAILTAVMQVNSSGQQTVLLDDIELALHPSAQRDLVRQLIKLQQIRPGLQIIFSSHSPYVIDEMQPEDVWLFTPDKEGIAHCAKLSEHPDAKRALEVLTTGEFWSAEGESWVLDRAKRSNEETVAAK